MKLAAIDIGSNAVRLQITKVIRDKEKISFKKMEYVRFPLRLGHDVFTQGYLSQATVERFIKLMRAYQLLIELYEVDAQMAVATSAMREATNGAELVHMVADLTGLEIEIIDGQKEASMINDAIFSYIGSGPSLHIDVGGGSTELNLYIGHEKVQAESFPIGSVRGLKKHDSPEMWELMHQWVLQHIHPNGHGLMALGTGGNINKIFELAVARFDLRKTKVMSLAQALEVVAHIKSFDIAGRESVLQLNPDRADVILPAAEIYLTIMQWAGAKQITVPDVGLKDGIMQHLYRSKAIPS